MKVNKIVKYEVAAVSKTSFPTPMLRNDRAWPNTEEDAVKLSHACRNFEEFAEVWKTEHGPATVGLASFEIPDERRWKSFGWKIVGPIIAIPID